MVEFAEEIKDIFLAGGFSDVPIIVCRNEDVAIYIQSWMHTHLTKDPPVTVASKWPKDLTADALAITPIHVLGTENPLSFKIDMVPDLKVDTQKVLTAAIRLSMVGKDLSVRNLASATYGMINKSTKRQIDYALRELEEKGLLKRIDERAPMRLTIGRWRPDPAAARAAGIDITEYK
jgi:hypothetical protein